MNERSLPPPQSNPASATLPEIVFVGCSLCDNRKCSNPAHLFLATHQENMADRDAKKRGKIPQHPRALSVEQVRFIRQSAERSILLAQRFGVDRHTIYNARHGVRTYKGVA